MAIFENLSVLLDLKALPFKERRKIRSAITKNGGCISYSITGKCSLVVTSGVADLSSNRLRSVQKLRTPVVGVDYVSQCVEQGVLQPLEDYILEVPLPGSSYALPARPPPVASPHPTEKEATPLAAECVDPPPALTAVRQTEETGKPIRDGRVYTEEDCDLPTFPEDFQVAKYSIFKKVTDDTWCVLELQSARLEGQQVYRVVLCRMEVKTGPPADTKSWYPRGSKQYVEDYLAFRTELEAYHHQQNQQGSLPECASTALKLVSGQVSQRLVFPQSSTEAVDEYQALREELEAQGLRPQTHLPPDGPQELGSTALKMLLLEESVNKGSLPQEVGVFVELLWTEALGCLDNVLSVPVTNLSLNDVSRAEGFLLQAQKLLKEGGPQEEVCTAFTELYALLPHREPRPPTPTARHLSLKLDLCQLIRDMLNVSEINMSSPAAPSVGKYRSLRCGMETVAPETEEFWRVVGLLSDRKVNVLQVLRVTRWAEQQTFQKKVGNIKPLLHSTAPSNFVGILSRGLLLPRVGAEDHGIQRTDVGNLGSGIYFTDSMSTSLKYSKPSDSDGSRLVLVCDVALGRCHEVRKKDPHLTGPPDACHSVHGLRHTPTTRSEFVDDELVVYSPGQVLVKYVVRFTVEGDQLREFTPTVDSSPAPPPLDARQETSLKGMGLESIKNPLDDVTAGLLDSSGKQLPLQAVHVKCKLMDLLSQVIIFQKYTNQSSVPIEAKYVFPLEDSAVVCGFEAFINGKHVVGQVKEKETARKEYKQAIQQGHGAYLMDQDAPDVFTISVGNLPPGATVLIKVTYVSELVAQGDSILFSLPGSVAPWQQREALNQTTQATVEKTCVTNEEASSREFSLQMSIEMPYKIQCLQCHTHKVQFKTTDCKAVGNVLPGEVVGADGFQLNIALSQLHLPRMWVENHPEKQSQACMLVFFPEFPVGGAGGGGGGDEVVVLLDASESMVVEGLVNARLIALEVLKALEPTARVNVIFFGTEHTELFLFAKPLSHALKPARKFILSPPPTGGSTELWRPLRALSLLPPSSGLRNILLLSDGHIQNPALALQLLRDNSQHSRLFTCGLSSTANQHMLRTLAQAGGGAYEFFDTKTKHNWKDKVAAQVRRMRSPGCSSVSVKWQQFSHTAPPPVQAPQQIHALFNHHRTLVFGFVPHCTQASLLGNLGGMEVNTVVSTSELQKTRGTFLHKLTARALIRDYETGTLSASQAEHEGKKAELRSFIVELSKEFSILSQFTSFVAIEERDPLCPEEPALTDFSKIIAEEDVDFLPYMGWNEEEEEEQEEQDDMSFCSDYWVQYSSVPQVPRVASADSIFAIGEAYSGEMELATGEGYSGDMEFQCNGIPDMGFRLHKSHLDVVGTLEGSMEQEVLMLGGLQDEVYEVYESPAAEVFKKHSMDLSHFLRSASSPPLSPSPPSGICMTDGAPPPPPSTNLMECVMVAAPSPPPILHGREDVALKGLCRRSVGGGAGMPGAAPPPPSPPLATPLRRGLAYVAPPTVFDSDHMNIPRHHLQFKSSKCVTGGAPPAFARTPLASKSAALPLTPSEPPTRGLFGVQSAAAPLTPSQSSSSTLFGWQSAAAPLTPSQSSSSTLFGGQGAAAPPTSSQPFSGIYFGRKGGAAPLTPSQPASSTLFSGQGGAPPLTPSHPLAVSFFDGKCDAAPLAPPQGFHSSGLIFGAPQPSTSPLFGGQGGAPPLTPPQPFSGWHCAAPPLTPSQPFSGTLFGGPIASPPALPSLGEQVPLEMHSAKRLSSEELVDLRRAQKQASYSQPAARRRSSAQEVEVDGATEVLLPMNRSRCLKIASDTNWTRSAQRRRRSQTPPAELSVVEDSTFTNVCVEMETEDEQICRMDPEQSRTKWTKIFEMQCSEGYWECSAELGELLKVDIHFFANVFLKNKGICSLGVRARADILRLLASLLVLQLMRLEGESEGKLLRSLFILDTPPDTRPAGRWPAVKRAVDWARWADRQYPCIYSRLEFGRSWESSTRQLLGLDPPPAEPLVTWCSTSRTPVCTRV